MKTLQDHITVMDETLTDPTINICLTGDKRLKAIGLMEGLANSTCRDYRRRTLAKLRDTISYLFVVPEFASIKSYELWCK